MWLPVYMYGLCVNRIKSGQVNLESSTKPFIKPPSSLFPVFSSVTPPGHSARALNSPPGGNLTPPLATDSLDSQLPHDL